MIDYLHYICKPIPESGTWHDLVPGTIWTYPYSGYNIQNTYPYSGIDWIPYWMSYLLQMNTIIMVLRMKFTANEDVLMGVNGLVQPCIALFSIRRTLLTLFAISLHDTKTSNMRCPEIHANVQCLYGHSTYVK